MAESNKFQALIEKAQTALIGKRIPLVGALSKDMLSIIALGVAVALILGLGVLVNWALYGDKDSAESRFVADFVESCMPGATQNYLTAGLDGEQAETSAKEFCQCVGTTVSESTPPEVFAQVSETKKMTRELILAIGLASQTCQ